MKRFNNKNNEIEERFILCLDGGGMRGIIPSIILKKISTLFKEKGESKPFYSFFDLIAGTSTGGLIALGLTTPPMISSLEKEKGDDEIYIYEEEKPTFIDYILRKKKPTKQPKLIIRGTDCSSLIKLYKENGKDIFPNQTSLFGQFLKAKYDPTPFENFLKKLFNDAKLSQCLVPTLAVSYEIQKGRPYLFKSWDSKDFLTREAARATSAAPTYFPPASLNERPTDEKLTLIDGALIANNPVIMAYGEAKKLYPNCQKFHILSISTGAADFKLGEEEILSGLMGWIDPSKGAPIQKIYATSQMQLASYAAEISDHIEYTRIDKQFQNDNFKLDDTSSQTVKTLEDYGNKIFENQKTEIDEFVDKILKRKDFSQVTDLEFIEQEDKRPIKEYKEAHYVLPPIKEEEKIIEKKKPRRLITKLNPFNRKESIPTDKNNTIKHIEDKSQKKDTTDISDILKEYGIPTEDYTEDPNASKTT